MHQVLIKKIGRSLLITLMLLSVTACKAGPAYLVKDYLDYLAYQSGLDSTEDHQDLYKWGVLKEDDSIDLYEEVRFEFLKTTLNRLIDDDIIAKGWIKEKNNDTVVDKKVAEELIDLACSYINDREFEAAYEFKGKDNIFESKLADFNISDHKAGDIIHFEDDSYKKVVYENDKLNLEDASFDDVYVEFNAQDSFDLDLSQAIDIPYGENNDDIYVNNKFNLLASNSRKKFSSEGFDVSYKISSSGIDVHITKDVAGYNAFFDFALSNIHPSYKWNYHDGKVENAYFKVDYKTVEEIGFTTGKYQHYYLDLKDLDPSSFMASAKSLIKEKDDEVEGTIKICEIKTPIPSMPTLYFNIDVLARVYMSGKVELVLANTHCLGFEVKNGNIRFISNNQRDLDGLIGASSRAVLGVNFNIEALKARLFDVEADVGLKASISTTAHLYDEDGNDNAQKVEMNYAALNELAEMNDEVKICADLSFNWVFDVIVNTSKTLLSKCGFSMRKSILNENDQVFNNLTHIENGTFVENCTRKSRPKNKVDLTAYNIDKIVVEKYAVVLNASEGYTIGIKSLPEAYDLDDLEFISKNIDAVSVDENGNVVGLKPGSSEIIISTKDKKYSASVNVLVSKP